MWELQILALYIGNGLLLSQPKDRTFTGVIQREFGLQDL